MTANHRLCIGQEGAIALYIGGDLQFDSADERLYHEALALPALALALEAPGPLRVLICGGGDGLALREVLKSDRVERVELVDYDPEVLALARRELAGLNERAFEDPRVAVHVGDARAYVEARRAEGRRYELVISDLTWPQTAEDAAFHTVGWYATLAAVLAPEGAMALNAASPAATPEAYWTMVNGLRHVGLHARPYHVVLPSFQAHGYGPDWGMVLAGPGTLDEARLAALALPGARVLSPGWVAMGRFPAGHGAIASSCPPPGDGATLVERLRDPGLAPTGEVVWMGDFAPYSGPAPADHALLPAPMRDALALAASDADARDGLIERVLALVPGMQRETTRTFVSEFLAAPGRFLASLDLPALVDRLLERARELPARFVAELGELRQALHDPRALGEGALRVGGRLLAVVTVVVLLGNLAHPDLVYGKGAGGEGGGFSSGGFSHASRGAGDVDAPALARNPGYRYYGRGVMDESGMVYPIRFYRVRIRNAGGYAHHGVSAEDSWGPASDLDVAYRLSPDVGVTADGRLVMDLGDVGFFLIDGQNPIPLYDRETGQPVLTLAPQPRLTWLLANELRRQHQGLATSRDEKEEWVTWLDFMDFLPGSSGDRDEVVNMGTTLERLGHATERIGQQPDQEPPAAEAPDPNALELFNGAWLMPDAHLVVDTQDGRRHLEPARGWFYDAARQLPATTPYPPELRRLLSRYLAQQVKDLDANHRAMEDAVHQADNELAGLQKDYKDYQDTIFEDGHDSMVDYGTLSMPASRASQLTQTNIDATIRERQAMVKQLANAPTTDQWLRQLQAAFPPARSR